MACRKQQLTKYSPYSKMYLVSPGIYEKMLNCIDEGDKTATEALNTSNLVVDRKRPAEQVVDDMYKEELQRPPPLSNDQFEQLQPNIQQFEQNISLQDAPIIPNYDSNIVPLNVTSRGLQEPLAGPILNRIPNLPMSQPLLHEKMPTDRRVSQLFSEIESSIPISPIKGPIRRFPCQFCDKTFSRKHDAKRHVSEKHDNKGKLENPINEPGELEDAIAESSAAYESWMPSSAETLGEEPKSTILDPTPTKRTKLKKVEKTIRTPIKIHKTRSKTEQTASGMFDSWK